MSGMGRKSGELGGSTRERGRKGARRHQEGVFAQLQTRQCSQDLRREEGQQRGAEEVEERQSGSNVVRPRRKAQQGEAEGADTNVSAWNGQGRTAGQRERAA